MLRDLRETQDGKHGQTLVFSSHILAEVEALCDRVVILSRGTPVLDAPLDRALVAGHVQFEVRTKDDLARGMAEHAWHVAALPGAPQVQLERAGEVVRVRMALPEDDADALDRLRTALGEESVLSGVPLMALVPGRTRLEERFAAVTGGKAEDA